MTDRRKIVMIVEDEPKIADLLADYLHAQGGFGTVKVARGDEVVAVERSERAGLDVGETDLGEYIVQLRHEPPSHITAPALHCSAEQIRDAWLRHIYSDEETTLDDNLAEMYWLNAILRACANCDGDGDDCFDPKLNSALKREVKAARKAKVPDNKVLDDLLHGEEHSVHGDKASTSSEHNLLASDPGWPFDYSQDEEAASLKPIAESVGHLVSLWPVIVGDRVRELAPRRIRVHGAPPLTAKERSRRGESARRRMQVKKAAPWEKPAWC